MTARARLDGLYLLMLGIVMFSLLGIVLERQAGEKLVDLRMMYYPARCLLQHCDPYNETQVSELYRRENGKSVEDTPKVLAVVTRYVYPPSAFTFTAPFALLPWQVASVLWTALTMVSVSLAGLLIWNAGAKDAPVLSGLLIGFMIANSEVLVITGTVAGMVVSLCVIAVWCFITDRFVVWGIVCMALSLAIKPQDSGLIWLYFFLAGGIYRKRALETLLAVALMSVPMALWVWSVSPHWIEELRANLAWFTMRGGVNDPGPASAGGHGIAMVVSLQAIFSVLRDDSRFYNAAAFLLWFPLFIPWAAITLRGRATPARAWVALASMAALSMLPVYHRQYDAKLLLLTVPAFAQLWARGGRLRWLALLVSTAGFLFTGDVPWAIFFAIVDALHHHLGSNGSLWVVMEVVPVPLTLLAVGVFYLRAYARHSDRLPTPD